MFKNKKDIDKHVEKLLANLPQKEFKSRAYSIARLYFEVGDYANCQIYVEQYLTQKNDSAAAYKLLGKALQKMGQPDEALEQFKTSLDIDQTQTSTILDICELLSDGIESLEPGCGNYWLEKAEAIFPRHPVIFRLREKLVLLSDPDPEALVKLFTSELKITPRDPLLHSRLLKHYLKMNQFREAFDHSCNIEFNSNNFTNNNAWYEILDKLFDHNSGDIDKWLFQLLLLTVKERLSLLSLTETPSGSSKSLVESADLIHEYDQAIERVAKAGADPGFSEFHASLVRHHRGQFAFHAATLLLKRAKKDLISWRDATKSAAPLMLMAWHSAPLDIKVNWLRNAPEKQLIAVSRWHLEGTYRCSQSGHYLLTNFHDKNHLLLDEISQCCSGSHWKENLYERVFTTKTQSEKIKSSYFASDAFSAPQLRLPKRKELEAYDSEAQKEYGNSLHHFVWIMLNYKNYADFNCTVFDMLTSTKTSYCDPENLNKLDIYAFLYCAALTTRQKNANEVLIIHGEKPKVLPAIITDLLCPLPQMKWWDCAYKVSQNILGSDLTDIRTTLSCGIEVVRCIDNHGLDPELLCILGRLFSDQAKATASAEEKNNIELRAALYYSSAIPLLEKLKSKVMIKVSDKRLFDYTHGEIGSKQLNSLLEESKTFVAGNHINNKEYGQAIEILTGVKSPRAYYDIALAFKQLALEDKDSSTDGGKSKYELMLANAKTYAYKTLNLLKESRTKKNSPLFSDTQTLIQEIEICINKIDQNSSSGNDIDVNYSSDENVSYRGGNKRTNRSLFRNISSTPKSATKQNDTNYRTAIDSQLLESTQVSQRNLERIENEIKNLQIRDTTITDFMAQTKNWFEGNRNLGNTIDTINSNVQNTMDQFKKLKISVDQVKDQIDECRSECKDVGELKKQISELKKEVDKTKSWFEENRNLGNTINTINSNIQNTTDQFIKLKTSVDQVKDQIDKCRSECKDVGELKKQIYELKKEVENFKQSTFEHSLNDSDPYNLKKQIYELRKEVDKFKKSTSEHTVNNSDPYNLDEHYRTNEATSNYGQFPPQMPPGFNLRQPFPVPTPNPYQLYNQTMYNLYNQYSQFAQSSVPGAQHFVDPVRAQMNFPEQIFPDLADLIPPAAASGLAQAAAVPTVSVPPVSQGVPAAPIIPAPPLSTPVFPAKPVPSSTTSDFRDASRFPTNVVITSSNPLPTSASTPAPVLSVTIPQRHIKSNQPHDYQIAMPTATETKVSCPPVFSFSMSENKNYPVSSLSNWNKTFQTFTGDDSPLYKALHGGDTSFEASKSVVDGPFAGASQNTSLNKSRTLSEKSNTSVENYDPCPDFKPIIPLPAEVKVTTGEEDETAIFSARAKLFRFVDKQWKERGIGDMKLLKHNTTGKVRVLMRREQVHKVCANHTIAPETEISPMKNESKAYIWAANDFAEGTVISEKFCIRFKTSDNATQFYELFEKARQESKTLRTENKLTRDEPESKVTISNEAVAQKATPPPGAVSSQGKTIVGGFTFSSTPLFKPLNNDKTEEKNAEAESIKTNVFSTLAFNKQTGTATSFTNIFNTAPVNQINSEENFNESNKSKLNTSDNVDEFVPTAEFKPVIAMPGLIEAKTGEEDEIVLFEHRAKLFRFDSSSKEWKERGLGNIKLLARKDNDQKVRLLMRREQIMKVCCNHVLTKKMIFQKMTNRDKAVTWCAKDFSEGELVAETFCLRFKTSQIYEDFINAVQTAQSKMTDEVKALKEEQNSPIQTQSGFGDKFKAKAGSWSCQECYASNSELCLKCVCCSQPNPKPSASKVSVPAVEPPKSSNWGDQFKPKLGSWECKSCLVRNEAPVENCSACNTPKDPTSKKPTTAMVPDMKMNFSFGIPQQTAASIQSQTKTVTTPKTIAPAVTGFTAGLKPAGASWECRQCFARNDFWSENCCNCSTSQKANRIFTSNTVPSVKFSFGNPPVLTNEEKPKPESVIEGASKFSFGVPLIASSDSVQSQQKPTDIIYADPKMPTKTEGTLNISSQTAANTFASKESGFGFVLKKSSKSPTKSTDTKPGNESYGEDSMKEEDCAAHFDPVVPLPDKVEEVTGEESEVELFAHRARLYIFVSTEWKERGTGIVKVLKHKETSKLRVVMRREQVLKICLNHALTQDIKYNSQNERTWVFAANDFSEGTLSLKMFCLKFSNKETAMQFKKAVDDAIQNKKPVEVETKVKELDQEDDDDVVFLGQTQANAEDIQKAKDLMLPEHFYMYKHKEPCHGCRGCSEESKSDTKPQTITVSEVAAAAVPEPYTVQASVVTPIKAKLPLFQSPTHSIYGTPGTYGTPGNDKTFDNSTFRTPLGSIGSNTVSSTPADNSSDPGSDATNKENVFTNQTKISCNFGDQRSIFGTPEAAPAPKYDPKDSQTPVNTKNSLLAPPKLVALNVSGENQGIVEKSVFASGQVKPVFGEPSAFGGTGISSNKSIFGFAADKPKDDSNTEVRSIFGGNPTSVNLFKAGGSSMFGPGSLNSSQANSFSSQGLLSFGSSTTNSANNVNETNKLGTIWAPTPSDQNPVIELPMKLEDNLSFAALSTSASGFEKKPDFKWEGTGQQLFTSAQKMSSNNESGEADGTGDAEEEFDPHFEPIVPLPDKIVVTTGEEEEKKVFGERGKMYRFDEKMKEWKERGIGEVKILHHPQKNTYRILLRREQVHKAVLNMLIHPDIEIHPMKNCETAWTFLGRNFAETLSGVVEMLAIRFKTTALANSFRDRVNHCVRSLQAAAAAAIREQKEAQGREKTPVPVKEQLETKETNVIGSVAPLRLPKHLQDSARADMMFAAAAQQAQSQCVSDNVFWAQATNQSVNTEAKPNGNSKESTPFTRVSQERSQQRSQQPEAEADAEAEEEVEEDSDDDQNYENDPDYDDGQGAYCYEDEEDIMYKCEGSVHLQDDDEQLDIPQVCIRVMYDHEYNSPKIAITDCDNHEILVDMLVHTDTEFKMSENSCKWFGADFASNKDKTVTVNFFDNETAWKFFESVQTCRQSGYYTMDDQDPE